MLAISGDVVIQTLGLIIVALIGSGFAYLAARRAGRTEQQMIPNGGESLRDRVNLIEAKVDDLAAKKAEDHRLLNEILDHITKGR